MLQNNGADDLTISADGEFTFATPLADGSTYAVAVISAPAGQTCSVSNGFATLAGANVTSVAVICSSESFTVGGTVIGLAGTLVLQNNGADDLTLTADGPCTFATPLADGSTYAVTVFSAPAGQTCAVSNGTGSLAGADAADVAVTCNDIPSGTFTIGGSVTGLTGTLVLQNNGADDLTLTTDG